MKILIIFAIALCAYAAEEKNTTAVETDNKDKRQTQGEFVPSQFIYRTARKQESVAPVEEPQEEDRLSRGDEDYRPGQVFSLNSQELLEFQQERKAPLSNSQQLQQLYNPQDRKQNLQQIYYLEPQQSSQQGSLSSHAVIARPHYSADGGEASVGAALSVSDTGSNTADSFDQELLELLNQATGQEVNRQAYVPAPQQQVSSQNVAPQYQQIDRYIAKPSKKPTKIRSKVGQVSPPQAPSAPQQYLIETTNVQPQAAQHQQQYRPAPQAQTVQALRYVPAQPLQQILYERPESDGIKVIAAPKLQPQQQRAQPNYRFVAQYQQPEATPKQYRIVEAPRLQPIRQEQKLQPSPVERPVAYLKRFPEPEKVRAVKYYDQAVQEVLPAQQPLQQSVQQPVHIMAEQYYLRPVYRNNPRYEVPQARAVEPTKVPQSSIYVSKNIIPKKTRQHAQQVVRIDPALKNEQRSSSHRADQATSIEQVQVEQHGQNLDDQRAHLPPPRNNKAYTPEEFAALVAAGYSVTPVPVSPQPASRSSIEPAPVPSQRRPFYSRRHQYLPLRSDDAP